MKSLIVFVWLGSIAVAFVVGYYLRPTEAQHQQSITNTPNSAHLTNQYNNAKQSDNQGTGSLSSASSIDTNTQLDVDKETFSQTIVDKVKNLLGSDVYKDLGGIAAAYNLISDLSKEDLLTNLENLLALAEDPEYSTTFALFLDRYASLEPFKALTLVQDMPISELKRLPYINIAISKWSQKEPRLALDWYNDNSEVISTRFNSILRMIFFNLANQDQDLAIKYLEDYATNKTELSKAISGIASSLQESVQYRHLLDKTAYLDNANVRANIIRSWMRMHHEDTLDWFDTLPEQANKIKLEEEVFSAYMLVNSKEAADWYLSRAEPTKAQNRAHEIINRWTYSKPEDALDWVSLQTSINMQEATIQVLKTAALMSPNFTISKLDLLESDEDKSDISSRVFSALKRESEKKALIFLNSSPYREAILEREARLRAYQERQ